jgi:hypothetical protein
MEEIACLLRSGFPPRALSLPRRRAQYIGQLRAGRYHGVGNLRLADGDHYRGTFEGGTYHGYGEYKSKSGKSSLGIWEGGKLVRRLTVESQ